MCSLLLPLEWVWKFPGYGLGNTPWKSLVWLSAIIELIMQVTMAAMMAAEPSSNEIAWIVGHYEKRWSCALAANVCFYLLISFVTHPTDVASTQNKRLNRFHNSEHPTGGLIVVNAQPTFHNFIYTYINCLFLLAKSAWHCRHVQTFIVSLSDQTRNRQCFSIVDIKMRNFWL